MNRIKGIPANQEPFGFSYERRPYPVHPLYPCKMVLDLETQKMTAKL
jgi:hypothetical protein